METRFDQLAKDIPTDNSKIPWYKDCKGCMFAEPDCVYPEGTITGYRKGVCMIYPQGKPTRLDRGGECEYYEEDE